MRIAAILLPLFLVPGSCLGETADEWRDRARGDLSEDLQWMHDVNYGDDGIRGAVRRCSGYGNANCGALGKGMTPEQRSVMWQDILSGLGREDVWLMHKRYKFDEGILREVLGESQLPPWVSGREDGAGGEAPPEGSPEEQYEEPDETLPTGARPADAGDRNTRGSRRRRRDWDNDDDEEEEGKEGEKGKKGEDRGDFRALSGDQAAALGAKTQALMGQAGSLFGPPKEPEELPPGEGERGGDERPRERAARGERRWERPSPGENAAARREAVAKFPKAEGQAPDMPKRYFRSYSRIPAPSARGRRRPGPAGGQVARRPAGAQVPGAGHSGSRGGFTVGSGMGGRSGRAARSRAAPAGPAKRRKSVKKAREGDDLTEEERAELDAFLKMIEEASKTGKMDSAAMSSSLVRAEADAEEGSMLAAKLADIRSIMEDAGRQLGPEERAAVLASAHRLGLDLSSSEAYKLFYALESSEPPPPFVARKLTFWQKVLRWLRRLLSRIFG